MSTNADRWTGAVARPTAFAVRDRGSDVVLLELIDVGLEEAERKQSLANPQDLAKLQNRPVAIASAIVKIR